MIVAGKLYPLPANIYPKNIYGPGNVWILLQRGVLSAWQGCYLSIRWVCNDGCLPRSIEQRLTEVAKDKACHICAERTDLTPQECYNLARNELHDLHPAAVEYSPPFFTR